MSPEIQQIIQRFDFERARKLMVKSDWKWNCKDGSYQVPSIQELKDTAIELLERLEVEEDTWRIREGCFQAERTPDGIELVFMPPDWGYVNRRDELGDIFRLLTMFFLVCSILYAAFAGILKWNMLAIIPLLFGLIASLVISIYLKIRE